MSGSGPLHGTLPYGAPDRDLRRVRGERVSRGGSFLCSPEFCQGYRASARNHTTPDTSLENIGFRCVADPEHITNLAGSVVQKTQEVAVVSSKQISTWRKCEMKMLRKTSYALVMILMCRGVDGAAACSARCGYAWHAAHETNTGCRCHCRPNIIVILADDLGYADISAYKIDRFQTPNIDRIGMEGVRFTDGYATAPVCGPSRAGLMTGRYQDRFGFEYNDRPGPARSGTGVGPCRRRNHHCAAIEGRRLSHRHDRQVASGQPEAVLSHEPRL